MESVCGEAQDGAGEEGSEVVGEEVGDDANHQGVGASGDRAQGVGEEEAIHHDEDEGDVGLGGLREEVHDRACVRTKQQGGEVEVGMWSESVHAACVVVVVAGEFPQPRGA